MSETMASRTPRLPHEVFKPLWPPYPMAWRAFTSEGLELGLDDIQVSTYRQRRTS